MATERQPSYWAAGWATFAGIVMIMLGVFHAIAGLTHIVDPDAYAVSGNYVFKLTSDTWGWVHLIWGIIVLFAGFGVFRGAVWARTIGVIIALVSAIANFAYLPYIPVWSIAMIAISVAVIWALTVHGRDVTAT